MCMAESVFPKRLALKYLKDIEKDFNLKIDENVRQQSLPFTLNSQFAKQLETYMVLGIILILKNICSTFNLITLLTLIQEDIHPIINLMLQVLK